VSGRWDNTILVIDLAKAMEPANDGTQNAIVSRVRVTPISRRHAGERPAGQRGALARPALRVRRQSLRVGDDQGCRRFPARPRRHHRRGQCRKALDPANNMTLNAVEAIIPTGNFGPVGLAVTADGKYALVSGSEGDGPEDGGRVITVVDLTARKALHHVELAWGNPAFRVRPLRSPTRDRIPRSAASPTPTASSSVRAMAACCSPPTAARTTCR
jgi:DNA-binding beta-propeller fold protein YncE